MVTRACGVRTKVIWVAAGRRSEAPATTVAVMNRAPLSS
jgi:hypothetical protein